MNKTGASLNRGGSKQDYQTPNDFIGAVERRFGDLMFDLAASENNRQAHLFYSIEENSLTQDWSILGGNLWLNPPFSDIEPWARKCAETSANDNRRILFLVPASVGSEWYRNWVEPYAYVLGLNPRLTFVGCEQGYPKDCILAVYGHGLTGFRTWRWK